MAKGDKKKRHEIRIQLLDLTMLAGEQKEEEEKSGGGGGVMYVAGKALGP